MAIPPIETRPKKLRRSTYNDQSIGSAMPKKVLPVGSKDSTENTARRRRAVSFGNVQVREFDRIAGDHPLVSKGPSLALDWGFIDNESTSLNQYESTRELSSILSPLNCETRRFILTFVFDISSEDIKRSEKIAAQTQAQRRETLSKLKVLRSLKPVPPRQDLPELVNTKSNVAVVEDPLPRPAKSTSSILLRKVQEARKRLVIQGIPSYTRNQ
jgi:hypothetical protein